MAVQLRDVSRDEGVFMAEVEQKIISSDGKRIVLDYHPSANSNPAAFGLVGFNLATFLGQLHVLGYVDIGSLMLAGLFMGGLMQLLAGLHEFQTGNVFGYSAFCTYGIFWIIEGITMILEFFGIPTFTTTGNAWFHFVFFIYTFVMAIAALYISKAMAWTLVTLAIGLALNTLALFSGSEALKYLAVFAMFLVIAGGLYMHASIVLQYTSHGKFHLSLGKPVCNYKVRIGEGDEITGVAEGVHEGAH